MAHKLPQYLGVGVSPFLDKFGWIKFKHWKLNRKKIRTKIVYSSYGLCRVRVKGGFGWHKWERPKVEHDQQPILQCGYHQWS